MLIIFGTFICHFKYSDTVVFKFFCPRGRSCGTPCLLTHPQGYIICSPCLGLQCIHVHCVETTYSEMQLYRNYFFCMSIPAIVLLLYPALFSVRCYVYVVSDPGCLELILKPHVTMHWWWVNLRKVRKSNPWWTSSSVYECSRLSNRRETLLHS